MVRLKVPGRLAWAAAALAALVGAAIVLVHTPPAARWGRDWLVRQVAAQFQLDLATSRLAVNLFTRRVTLDDVRLSAPGHADAPFLTARRLEAHLPWAVFGGTVRVSMLEVDDARVWLVREGGAIVNLPPPSGQPPPAVARRFDLRGLRARNLAVDYEDRTGDVDVSVSALTLSLDERDIRIFAGASGTIAAERLRVRMGAHETTSGALSGRLAFDGSNVSLQALTVPLPEGRIVVDGRVNRALDDLRFALTLSGSLDYEALAAWTPPPVPVSGAGAFEGTFEGPLGGYELRANFTAPGLHIGRATGLPLAGTIVVTPPRAHVETFTVTAPATSGSPRDGVITGQFTYEFGRGASELVARFRDLDLDVALAANDQAPTTFAAWQRGEVTLRRASPQAPMQITAAGTSTFLSRADRVAVDGTWQARLADERWFVRHDHRLLDAARAYGTMAWPAADDPARSVLSGPLTLDITDVGPVIRAARRSGINLSTSLDGVTGPARGDLVMGGSMARMVIRGRVASDALALPTGAPATALADIVYDGDTLDATHFEITTPGARVAGNVAMGMVSGALAGAFTAAADDLPTLASPWASLAGLTGTARMAGTIGGTTAVPDVPFTAQSTPLVLDGQAIGTMDVEAHLRGTVIDITRGAVTQAPGVLNATGTVDYLTGAYDLDIDGKALHWRNPAEGAPVSAVTMDVAFRGAGTFDAPGGSGTLTATPVGGSIGDFIGAADVRWQFAGGVLNTTAFLPSLRTWAQATIEPRAPYAVRGVAAVNALDVQPFALAAGALTQAVTGTVGLSAAFDGTLEDPATMQAFVNLQQVALLVGGLPVTLDHPTRITARADDFSVDDLALTVGTSAIRASGRFRDTADRPLRATYTGSLSDVVALGRAVGVAPEVTATGGLNATWESRGGVANARSTVDVSTAWITVPGYPPLQALEASATYDGAVLSLERLAATWQGGAIAATARLPRRLLEAAMNGGPAPSGAPGRVDVTVKGLTHQALQPWLPAESLAQMDARVSATLGLDVAAMSLDGVRGTLVLDEARLTAAGVPITQERPARMSIAAGTLRFDEVAFSAGTPVVIGGSVSFRTDTELDVTLTGTPGLRPFSVLSPAMAVDGAATLNLRVTGTPQAPLVNGRIDLDDAEVVMRDPRVIASDISGPILFEGDRVTLGNLKGFLNGGDFEASGTARVLGVDVATGDFTFQARGVAVEYPKNVDSEIDALLQFAPGATPTLKGDVRILRGAYRATISLPALVAFNATRTVPRAEPGYLDRLQLDLSVSTEDDIIIDNNYGRFEAGASVRLQGTGARPAVTGRAELREGGEVFMLGGLYRLNESTIAFSNPDAIEPDMNISMVTRSNGADQTLTLSGTLDKLQTSVVSSDPNASPSLAALFVGGDTTLDRNDALRLLSGELLGVTGRAIGLDSLRLERGFSGDDVRQDPGLIVENADPATRLTLSKQLSSDVEVVLSQGIGQGALSGYVTYRPWRGVELRGTSLDNTDRLLSVRHDISFGGAKPAAAPRRAMGAVAAVSFVGAPAEDEAALRGRLRLTAGDTFDFIHWRDDVERLQTWYRERGYLEARVRASRADQADGRIALTYTVQRGPATELRVEGMEVPARLRRQLETAWSNAVFDRFLLDEIQSALQFELVRRNVLNARVEAVVSAAEPVKVITATVRDGQAATRRRILYEGAVTLSPAQLDAEVAVWGLNDWGWLYPPLIANAITNRYDAEGRRAAKVTAADPVVVDGEARLTVTIEEGPITTVTSATLAGAEPRVEGVEPVVAGLQGRPFRYGEVDAAVQQVAQRYRNAGYNNVQVAPVVSAPADGTSAEVRIDVTPGRQQRLAGVVVSGADRTLPGAVENALGLDPGDPVNFTQWAQARKRVFDTNVFRQVDVRPEVLPTPNADGTEAVNARVTVAEWPTWRLRYGLQLDDRSQGEQGDDTSLARRRDLGVVGNLQNRNVFGRAFTFGVFGQVARRLRSGNTYLTFPTLFGRAVQTNVFAGASRQDVPLDDTEEFFLRRERTQLSLEQRIRRGRALEIAYGYRLKREVLDALDPDDPFYLAPLTGRFTGTAFVDRRDDPFNASRGWFGSFNAERVTEFESNDDAIKLQGSYFRYQALGPVVLASAARVGASFLDPLSFGERFFLGGADTVRGYGESLLGPKTFTGSARGGNALLILNQEVRVPVYRWIRGVAFVDAGNVFESNSALSVTNLEVGYGVGLRLHTPFSIFRVDLGIPVNGAAGQRTKRWYFGLGHIF